MKNSPTLLGTRFVAGVLVLFSALLVTKLYIVQIVHGEAYSEKADRQYSRPLGPLYDRGAIFFETKSGDLAPAATLKLGYTVAITPSLITDASEAYAKLQKVYALDREDFLEKAGKTNDPYEEIGRRLTKEQADSIDELKIPGVAVYKERWRFYPGEKQAAHTVGFVGWDDSGAISGRYGLERQYEKVLSRDDEKLYVNFFAELFSNVTTIIGDEPETKGDVVTTIEPSVQTFLDTEVTQIQEKWSAKEVGAIVIDPATGEVIALSATPSFDPNNLGDATAHSLRNPLIENVYELGSILKPLTMAAGLDAGVVTPETTYTDKGFLEFDGAKISNFDKRGRGTVSMQEVLNQSLNTGVAFVVDRLGIERFSTYMRGFGIGQKTGIDLPSEVAGLADNLNSPRKIEHVTASYGQGIAITPIAATRALATLANRGMLPSPHVADRIVQKGGVEKKVAYREEARVISPQAADEITRMLVEVVDKALLEGKVKMEHYSIAAKTGTAQIANPAGGGYYEDRFLHSFFGYFPAYNPKFLVFYYALEPKGEMYAARTLTTPFINTAKFLINYYEVPPDR